MADFHDAKKVHTAIREVFHIKDMEDNIPRMSGMKYRRELLPFLFAKLGFNEGAEIGVRYGKYTIQFCKANPDLHMLAIDPWMAYRASIVPGYNRYSTEKQESIYSKALEILAPYNVTVIRKGSMDALADIEDRSLDFVYIDGDHTFDYIMLDIIHWARKVKVGGIMACHDYQHGTWAGVNMAIEAYTRAHHIDPWYVTKEAQPTAYWVNREHL